MDEREQLMHLVSLRTPRPSDAIVLLAGDRFHRVPRAAELYHLGYAPRIVVTSSAYDFTYGSFPSRMLARALESYDVREEHIIASEEAPHTRAEADATIAIAKREGWKRLILVTTEYHQYRAFLTWLKAIRDHDARLEIYMAPVHHFPRFRYDTRNAALLGEFDRIERYKEMGHVADYLDGINYLS